MDIKIIRSKLKTSLFGTNIYYKESIHSTNAYAMQLANEGAPEGTIVVTDYQTAGKGRLDRKWYSVSGQDLLISLLLRPELDIEMAQKIALATATILITSIKDFLRNRKIKISGLEVKWPNDVLLNGKKLGGILVESKLQNKTIKTLVIGVGLNVNSSVQELPGEIREKAITLFDTLGERIVIEELIPFFLKQFEQNYMKFERTNYAGVVKTWKKYCHQFGDPIIVKKAVSDETGIFYDVNSEGYLLYKTRSGETKKLVSGEIERK